MGSHLRELLTSPKFPEIYENIVQLTTGRICVFHTHFDRNALNQVCEKYSLPHHQII